MQYFPIMYLKLLYVLSFPSPVPLYLFNFLNLNLSTNLHTGLSKCWFISIYYLDPA